MTTGPLVSVVIPTRNRREMLGRAVSSVKAQTYSPIEIIIVDDASDDDTGLDWGHAIGVRYLPLTTNVGGSAARNIGVTNSGGELIAFLDSDDEWLPDKLVEQVKLLEESPRTGAVYCRYFSHDDRTGVRREIEAGVYRGDITEELMRGRCPHSVSLFLVRRAALDGVGGFDERLHGFQDTDLWIRLTSTWEFDVVDAPLAVLHDHASDRVTTDISARQAALDEFLGKWGAEMSKRIGVAGLNDYRKRHLAVAQGALILDLVRNGMRGRAFGELGRYLSLVGLINPRQLAGLLVAVVAGTDAHNRLRTARQRRQAP